MALTDTSVDYDNYAEAMKIFYGNNIVETLNRKVVLYDMLKKSKKGWSGKDFRFPVHINSANTVGARPHDGNLPDGGADIYLEAKVLAKYNYVRITAFNTVEAHSKSQAGAWAKTRAEQIKRRAKDLADSLNRQVHGDGTGVLCQVDSLSGAGSDGDPWVIELVGQSGSFATIDWAPETTKHLKKGMRVVWGNETEFLAGAGAGYGYVKALGQADGTNKSSKFLLVSTAGTAIAADDFLVIGNNSTAGDHSYAGELTGLRALVGTGTVQNISDGAYVSTVKQNPDEAGELRALTEDLMTQCVDDVDEETDSFADLISCHHSFRREYVRMLKAKNGEQFAPTKVKGGYDREYLSFAASGRNIPLVEDKDAEHYGALFLSKSELEFLELSPFTWDSSSGGVWKWVSAKDQATGFGKIYTNMCIKNRKAAARLEDIAVTGVNR